MTRAGQIGTVYFAKPMGREWVKIGFAFDPCRRLSELQCGSPEQLEVIFSVPGTMRTETNLRLCLRDVTSRGEWKAYGPRAVELIERLRTTSRDIDHEVEIILAEQMVAVAMHIERSACEMRRRLRAQYPDITLCDDALNWGPQYVAAIEIIEAADRRIDHTEEPAVTAAADHLIATYLPLSSARRAE